MWSLIITNVRRLLEGSFEAATLDFLLLADQSLSPPFQFSLFTTPLLSTEMRLARVHCEY